MLRATCSFYPAPLTGCLLLVACSGQPAAATGGSSAGGSSAGGVGDGAAGGLPAGGGARGGTTGASGSGGAADAADGGSAAGGGGALGGMTASGGVGAGGAGAGGGTAAGGDGAAGGGGAGGAGPAIDFAAWALQLPIGSGTSPTTISSKQLLAGFSNAYFYVAADGGQAFMDPAMGITTSGSQHCRTEMREQTPGAGNAAWASSGTNTLSVEGKVVKLGGGSVAVAQVFNSDDSIPLCELQYTSGHKFSLLYEEAKGGGSSTDLKTPVALDTRYSFSLALSAGQLSVTINGQQVYSHTPSAGILSKKFYFKVGNYDQSTSAGTPDTTPYSVVEAYKVDVVHL